MKKDLLLESFGTKLGKFELKSLMGGFMDITMGIDKTQGINGTTTQDKWCDQID